MQDFKLRVDMDGVLADFEKGYTKQTGIPFLLAKELSDRLFWKNILDIPNFFYNLPLMEDAFVLWNAIAHLNPSVLTTIPRTDTYPTAGIEKKMYIAEHFGKDITVNLSPSAKSKIHWYRPGTRDIIIDDRLDTIETWNAAGGIGIYHTSALETIRQLKEKKII